MKTIRTFLALPVNHSTEKQLFKAQEIPLHCRRTNHPHITLLFIGDTTPEQLSLLKTTLANFEWPALLNLHTTRIAPFPKNSSKILAAFVEPNSYLTKLQKTLAELFRNSGLPCDHKRFSPHITLARSKSAIHCNYKPVDIEFTVEQAVLFQSELKSEGSHYTALQKYRLKR